MIYKHLSKTDHRVLSGKMWSCKGPHITFPSRRGTALSIGFLLRSLILYPKQKELETSKTLGAAVYAT
jgi:hypothetical protein